MDAMKMSLDGKVALVTGGSLGIGRAIALTFADAGADVAVASRTLADLQSVAGEIKSKGRRGLPIVSDVADIQQSKVLVEKVLAEFGRIDILVNNAGSNPWTGPLIKLEEWAWDATFNLNLKGLFFLSQFVAPIMKKEGGGNIINMASVGGIKLRKNSVYSVTKAGVIMLTKAMAKEWGQYNIRVNGIAPGLTKTPLSEPLWKDPANEKELAKEPALGRLGMPEDIARVALFLASDLSSHITGDIIVADAGELLGPAPWPD
jgi:NAD(P)-dependent dehydrogenase (short-subunit alcohol dehydrogenase family)